MASQLVGVPTNLEEVGWSLGHENERTGRDKCRHCADDEVQAPVDKMEGADIEADLYTSSQQSPSK